MPSTQIPAVSFRSHISAVVQRAEVLPDKSSDIPVIFHAHLKPDHNRSYLIKGPSTACAPSNPDGQGWDESNTSSFLLKGTSISPAWLS